MASWKNDNTEEFDEDKFLKRNQQHKVVLVKIANELEARANRTIILPPPLVDSVHSQPDLEYNVLQEMQRIHRLVKENGQQGDFGMEMKFGDLIPIYGADKVERLIEVLAIARKNGYLNYPLKDFFHQDRDEDIFIRLIKTPF